MACFFVSLLYAREGNIALVVARLRPGSEHGERLVLSCLHDLSLTGSLVVDAAKVEDAVDDDTVELFVVGTAELVGISKDGVERDEDVAADGLALTVVEGDDVSIVVMPQILVVDFEYLLVVDKHVSDLAYLPMV